MDSVNIEELRQAGLLDEDSRQPQLTAKGRDWLQALASANTSNERPISAIHDAAEDLVLSTSGLFR